MRVHAPARAVAVGCVRLWMLASGCNPKSAPDRDHAAPSKSSSAISISPHSEDSMFAPTVENAAHRPAGRPKGWSGFPAANSRWAPRRRRTRGAAAATRSPTLGPSTASTSTASGWIAPRSPTRSSRASCAPPATSPSPSARRRRRLPDAPPENLVAGSVVFDAAAGGRCRSTITSAGGATSSGASWRHPLGPGSDLRGREHTPSCRSPTRTRRPTRMGRQAAADRGRVRVRGARRAGGQALRLGRRAASRRTLDGQHLPGPLPRIDDTGEDGWAGLAPGRLVPAQRLRPLRHRRQRLGVVQRLVSTRLLRDARRARVARNPGGPRTAATRPSPASPSACSAAARSSAPSQYCTRYLVGARGKGEPSTAPTTSASAASCRRRRRSISAPMPPEHPRAGQVRGARADADDRCAPVRNAARAPIPAGRACQSGDARPGAVRRSEHPAAQTHAATVQAVLHVPEWRQPLPSGVALRAAAALPRLSDPRARRSGLLVDRPSPADGREPSEQQGTRVRAHGPHPDQSRRASARAFQRGRGLRHRVPDGNDPGDRTGGNGN